MQMLHRVHILNLTTPISHDFVAFLGIGHLTSELLMTCGMHGHGRLLARRASP